MNERIRELAEYCGYNGDYCTEDFSLEMFAELIIRECIDIVPWQYEEKIKNHFGVE